MNECLITKLKSTIVDDNLLKLGEFRFDFVISEEKSFSIGLENPESAVTVKFEGDVSLYNFDKTVKYDGGIASDINQTAKTFIVVPNKNGVNAKLRIFNYYNVNYLTVESFKKAAVKPELNAIQFIDNLKTFMISGNQESIDLSCVPVSITQLGLSNSNLSNLSNLGKLTALTLLRINSVTSLESTTIQAIANNMVSLGRTSGTLKIEAWDTSVIVDEGNNIDTITIVFSSEYENGWSIDS